MGRRKIAIEAIKDERNRSVTFLKRKGGLFKKAHELSVLCSVDVAVIIYGQNKKLYEFSSGDIREFMNRHTYYDHPHEHKGPNDFAGKGGGDDDDDIDENAGSEPPEDQSPPHHGVSGHNPYQNSSGLPQHMLQHDGSSASPPMPNGQYHQRTGTPPTQNYSRPSSRTQHSRRPSSNLVPQNHPNPQATQPQQHMNYGYGANSHFYHPQAVNMNQQHALTQPRPQQPYPHQQNQQQPAQHSQLQQMYLQDQRRHSMSPNFMQNQHNHHQQQQSQQERPNQVPVVQTPPQLQRPYQSPPLPEPNANNMMPKAHTIDTGNQSNQQYWRPPPQQDSKAAVRREEAAPRSQSIDVGSQMRQKTNGASPPQNYAAPPATMTTQPPRTGSIPAGSPDFAPPSRMNSMTSDAKRPRLKVEIPKEASETGSNTGSSPKDGSERVPGATPIKATHEGGHASAIVLPPPSPSAGAVLSAGATGPTNPFAKPPPPNPIVSHNVPFKDVETPMSALPSRFLGDNFSSNSPSNLFGPDWNNYNMSNYLQSPATYQPSPINMNRPTLGTKDEPSEKRRKSDDDIDSNPAKRAKS